MEHIYRKAYHLYEYQRNRLVSRVSRATVSRYLNEGYVSAEA